MTNTVSPTAVEPDELASRDVDALSRNEGSFSEADRRELAVYGFDSEQRTLVGLGPVERARRSRQAAEAPDSQRMPPSEPPGPFIADDDAVELARVLRGAKLGPWAAVVPAALVVLGVVVATTRAFAPGTPAPKKLTAAAAHVKVRLAPAALTEPTRDVPAAAELATEDSRAAGAPASERPAAHVDTGAHYAASTSAPSAPGGNVAVAPVAPPVLPVKLPELAPPAVVEITNDADANVGTLNVTSSPPANVVLDGRPLGKAPRLVRVPAGTHTVVFLHPLYGRQSRSVVVKAGRTSSASADF